MNKYEWRKQINYILKASNMKHTKKNIMIASDVYLKAQKAMENLTKKENFEPKQEPTSIGDILGRLNGNISSR